jgi:hypothetical protein
LSSSDQCRRRPTSSAAKSSIGVKTEEHDIRPCLTTIHTVSADGPRRRHTKRLALSCAGVACCRLEVRCCLVSRRCTANQPRDARQRCRGVVVVLLIVPGVGCTMEIRGRARREKRE